ncbi:MAG: aminotransferase class V-fold PLP-dependent enzyme [Firmicutes bacterium]|nr:aminotransferase class V-fold PLP-dependent enzyme [Bacillota bacterium]
MGQSVRRLAADLRAEPAVARVAREFRSTLLEASAPQPAPGAVQPPDADHKAKEPASRRSRVLAGFAAIELHERPLFSMLMDGLASIPGVTVYGLPAHGERTPTVSFTMAGRRPADVAKFLGDRGIFVWHGDFYATTLIERLGLAESGGVVRVGIAPYNTAEEVSRLLGALREYAGN